MHGQANSLHMAMSARAQHLEGRRGGHEGLALQRAADDVDQRIGQVRQIAQRLVLDLAAFAVAAAQQVGAIDLVLVDTPSGDYVCGSIAGWHAIVIDQAPCDDKWLVNDVKPL
jgi:hypothetical protein